MSFAYDYTFAKEGDVYAFANPLQKASPRVSAGQSYTDPRFGTRVTRITDIRAGNPPTSASGVTNEYAKFDPDSAQSKWLLLRNTNATWSLYNGQTLRFVRSLPASITGDIEPRWHGSDSDVLFYHADTRFFKFNAASDQSLLLHDFKREYPDAAFAYTHYEGGGSRDSRLWAFIIANGNGMSGVIDLVTFDAETRTITAGYRKTNGRPPAMAMDAVSISPSGKYALIEGGYGPSYVCNADWTNCRQMTGATSYGHSDFAVSADGRDMFVAQNNSTDKIEAVYLDTLEAFNVQDLSGLFRKDPATGQPVSSYPGLHVSGNSTETKPGWVLVSTYGDGADAKYWSDGAIYMLELKPNGRAWMIAHTNARTAPGGGKDYWAEAFAAINNEGTRVYWASNWGITGQDYVDVYQVTLPETWHKDLSTVPAK